MAGKLSWALSIEGIPEAMTGLKKMDKLVQAMTRHVNALNAAFERFGRNFGGRRYNPSGSYSSGIVPIPRALPSNSPRRKLPGPYIDVGGTVLSLPAGSSGRKLLPWNSGGSVPPILPPPMMPPGGTGGPPKPPKGFSGLMDAFAHITRPLVRLGIILWAIRRVVMMVTRAFEQLGTVFVGGARLYEASARTAVPMGQLMRAERAASIIGISPQQIEDMAVEARARGARISTIGGMRLGATRMGNASLAAQIQNMRPSLENALNSPEARLAEIVANRVGPAFETLTQQSRALKQDFTVMMLQVVEPLTNSFKGLVFVVDELVKAGSQFSGVIKALGSSPLLRGTILGGLADMLKYGPLALLGKMIPNVKAPGQAPPMSQAFPHSAGALERIGFMYTGQAGKHDYGKDIAAHTKELVDILKTDTKYTGNRNNMNMYVPNAAF